MLDEKPQKTKKKKKGHEKSVDEESIKKESDHKEHVSNAGCLGTSIRGVWGGYHTFTIAMIFY